MLPTLLPASLQACIRFHVSAWRSILFTSQNVSMPTRGWWGVLCPGSAMWAWLDLGCVYCCTEAGISLPCTERREKGRVEGKWDPRTSQRSCNYALQTRTFLAFLFCILTESRYVENFGPLDVKRTGAWEWSGFALSSLKVNECIRT